MGSGEENRVRSYFRSLAFLIIRIFIFPETQMVGIYLFWFNYLLSTFFPYHQFWQSRQCGCSLVSGLLSGNWFLLDHWRSLSRLWITLPHISFANIFQYLWGHNKLIHLYHINTTLEQSKAVTWSNRNIAHPLRAHMAPQDQTITVNSSSQTLCLCKGKIDSILGASESYKLSFSQHQHCCPEIRKTDTRLVTLWALLFFYNPKYSPLSIISLSFR